MKENSHLPNIFIASTSSSGAHMGKVTFIITAKREKNATERKRL
jgi:hypothetical protein